MTSLERCYFKVCRLLTWCKILIYVVTTLFVCVCVCVMTPAGYNYFGHERMYSGIDGREFEVDVFFGVVYYQRLRHMVSDKFQVQPPPNYCHTLCLCLSL